MATLSEKHHLSKMHSYSSVPKTSNEVISAIVWDKTRMETTSMIYVKVNRHTVLTVKCHFFLGFKQRSNIKQLFIVKQ